MARKNKASETTNNKNPKFNPFCTAKVWLPKKVPSAIISLNHKNIEDTTTISATKKNK